MGNKENSQKRNKRKSNNWRHIIKMSEKFGKIDAWQKKLAESRESTHDTKVKDHTKVTHSLEMADQNITKCNSAAIFNELDIKTDIKQEQHEVEGRSNGLYGTVVETELVNIIRMSKAAIEVLFRDIDTTNVDSISQTCKHFLSAARNILKSAAQYEASFNIQPNYNIEHLDYVGSLGWLISVHLNLKDILERAIVVNRLPNAGTLISRFTSIEKSLKEARTQCRSRYPNAHSMTKHQADAHSQLLKSYQFKRKIVFM